jgi:hypothetical protein
VVLGTQDLKNQPTERPKIYERRLVAFVDILGWSEACKIESMKLIEAAQIIHRAAKDYSNQTKAELHTQPGWTPNPMYMMVNIGAFSDNIAVSMPTSFGHRIIGGVADLCRNLLQLGFLTRGGITIGDLHHVENVIFGPALVEAVQLEKEAVYPRLVCSPALIDFLAEREWDARSDPIVSDHLGRKIANLFPLGFELTTGKLDRSYAEKLWKLSDIEAVLNGEIQKFTEAKSDKLAEKWRYMRDVLPIMLKRFE